MKFAQTGAPGAEQPVVIHKGRHYSLRGLISSIDGTFLSDGGPAAAAAALEAANLRNTQSSF
jgi:2,4-didehydro-3-deoxy-L-rhamnonate hydrolase